MRGPGHLPYAREYRFTCKACKLSKVGKYFNQRYCDEAACRAQKRIDERLENRMKCRAQRAKKKRANALT